ncbi:SCO family protein [Halochromatium glycolicum]|uniref:SCO family protein n=1 Tax=Halochromatium glycolicum TaxID=85075 RepID=A0AAJ0U562_9GAMM|nr:SCO family protein [Halochromatium glycolicum]MBK1705010.1 SCO family protein [Halochromatium glycolicum]
MATNLITRRNLLLFTLTLFGAIVTAYLLSRHHADPDQPLLHRLGQGGDFTLQSISGPTSLSDFKGKVSLLYIGYTHCPDVCPTSLAIISQALEDLSPEELEQVQPLFVSVDPERDTPERLAEYSQFFHPKIIGMTGAKKDLDLMVNRYGASYRKVEMKDSAMDYAVDHSSRIYLINKKGQLSNTLMHVTPPNQVVAEIRKLL